MPDANYEVVVSAGNLRPAPDIGVVMPHRWTSQGVVVEADFTGAHLYHLAAAGCVLNDLYREAERLDIRIGWSKGSSERRVRSRDVVVDRNRVRSRCLSGCELREGRASDARRR